MHVVRIFPKNRTPVEEFASVMVEAFATEGVHAYMLDFHRRRTRAALCSTARVELESFNCDGDYIFVALMDGRVVGGALLSRNTRHPLHLRIAYAGRWLRAAWPLLPSVRWSRLLPLHRATSLSRPIVGGHYVLSALAVQPDAQGRGIGSALLRQVHMLVERDPGVIGVYLYTGDQKNHLMYERKGYQTIETRRTGELTVYHMFRTNGGTFVTTDSGDQWHESGHPCGPVSS